MDTRIILKLILKNFNLRICSGYILLKTEVSGGFTCIQQRSFRYHEKQLIFDQ
jgi:hypothetical protein